MFITPEDFKRAFEATFIVNRGYLGHTPWDKGKEKTNIMRDHIYRTLANSFPDIKVKYEHNGIDAVLYRDDSDNIDVAIEHENDVKSIGTELSNFAKYNFPLNVLITYTGDRNEFLINRHSSKMNMLCDRLLLILNPEKCNWFNDEQKSISEHGLVSWEYLLWTKNGFIHVV